MPSRLEALQRDFAASITGARALPRFTAAVRGGGRLTAQRAVEVYRRAYPARLSEALGETFEACWRVLGDEDFLAACADFARRVPSVSHDLADYGEGFPSFLARRFRSRAPWIGSLGRLCWEFKGLFHEAPQAGLSAAELARRAGPSSRLRLIAPRRRLRLAHRVHAVWTRDRADETPIRPRDCAGTERVLLYKNGQQVWSRTLSPAEDAALASLEKGLPLGRAAAALEPEEARSFFSFLGSSGLVAAARR